jgi:ferredoxin
MKVKIDESACTGCEACVQTCPAVFEMGDDGLAKVKVTDVPAGEENNAKEAASACPATCIEVAE